MANSAADAPSTGFEPLQTRARWRIRELVEAWLEVERDQLALWLPVALGAGVALWFVLPSEREWLAILAVLAALFSAALAIGRGGRLTRVVAIGSLAAAIGLAGAWWRAERLAAPVLGRPTLVEFSARLLRVEPLPARDLVRLRLAPEAGSQLPPLVRVNLATADAPKGITPGAIVHLRARLAPPGEPSVPGAYDFARVAWFDGLGATGKGFAPVQVLSAGQPQGGLRQRLSQHITSTLPGSEGGIASALVTGDVGAIDDADNDAMRRAGLAHLLSVSGLHITAVVAATMVVLLRLLALSPWAALRFRLPLIAAGGGALAAIGYTLLTGSEVPTIRSCVAALMVLLAMALGREALTLRLVAAGALAVLVLWPEALAGPSFQLSFAAVTAIIALHENPKVRARFEKRPEAWWRKVARELVSLVATGLVVEAALAPIALYHFHREGIYGAFANIIAIPLTTFVVMPLEALALLLDCIGAGAPVWWLTGKSLTFLLWIARETARMPGSVSLLPAMPDGAYALMVFGGLWLALWHSKWRRMGAVPFAIGALWALLTPAPDLLVTGDGRHVAIRNGAGGIALLRDRAGDYTRGALAENAGVDSDNATAIADMPKALCNSDLCLVQHGRWRILATRSADLVPAAALAKVCGTVDIVVSDRGLPASCHPRWLKLDRRTLARTGGIAIHFASGRIVTVRRAGDAHPWRDPPRVTPLRNAPDHGRYSSGASRGRPGESRTSRRSSSA